MKKSKQGYYVKYLKEIGIILRTDEKESNSLFRVSTVCSFDNYDTITNPYDCNCLTKRVQLNILEEHIIVLVINTGYKIPL